MATYSLKKFIPVTTLGISSTTLYTVTAPATAATVKQILLTNYSSSAATVTVNFVPSGGSVGTTNVIISGLSISANSTITFDITQVLNVGDFIAASSSIASSINIAASGYEVV